MVDIPTITSNDTYWAVDGISTHVYDSRTADAVVVANADYVAWLAKGFRPVRVPSLAALGEALVQRESAKRPVNATVLDAYQNALAARLILTPAFQVLFNHENRIRALERVAGLNGSPPALTLQQAQAAIKPLM